MFQKYNIGSLVTEMFIERTSPEYCRIERKRFGSFRHELKSTVIKSHFFDGYFDKARLSDTDLAYIVQGYSPVRTGSSGKEHQMFTIHHIKPLVCGGETKPSNLIPIPRSFHDFLHEKIFDPQMAGLDIGSKKTLVCVPDFSKITLEMMMDPSFRIQYHKYAVDVCGIIPHKIIKSKHKNIRKASFNNWYQNNFGNMK